MYGIFNIIWYIKGGALTFASLSATNEFAAGAPFYGICDLNFFPLENINSPVLMNFGAEDDMKGFADAESA